MTGSTTSNEHVYQARRREGRERKETVMESRTWLGVRVPSGWSEVAAGAVKTVVIAFVALIAWDWIESGDFDPMGVGSNAVMVAIGLFLLDAILVATASDSRRGQQE
jgi:hypothetical protein